MLGSGMGLMPLWARACKSIWLCQAPEGVRADDLRRLVFAVVYWYLWTIAVPRWRGYRLEEEDEVLEDGTSVTKLVKVKRA